MHNMIEIEHLSKRFGAVEAVQNLSFHVKEGELFAFLGVNGAGKSTTINILCGQLAKDAGTVRIGGVDLDTDADTIKRSLGVVFQNSVLDQALTVQDNLESRAALYGITGSAFKTRLAELAALLDFEDLRKRPVGKLSGGQRRRIDIARALLHAPKLLILDELKNAYTGDFITLYGVTAEQAGALGCPCEPLRDACRVSVPDTAAATELILKYPELFRDYEITKGKMDDVFLAVTGKKLTGGAEK